MKCAYVFYMYMNCIFIRRYTFQPGILHGQNLGMHFISFFPSYAIFYNIHIFFNKPLTCGNIMCVRQTLPSNFSTNRDVKHGLELWFIKTWEGLPCISWLELCRGKKSVKSIIIIPRALKLSYSLGSIWLSQCILEVKITLPIVKWLLVGAFWGSK